MNVKLGLMTALAFLTYASVQADPLDPKPQVFIQPAVQPNT
jgi:hypothetical protein